MPWRGEQWRAVGKLSGWIRTSQRGLLGLLLLSCAPQAAQGLSSAGCGLSHPHIQTLHPAHSATPSFMHRRVFALSSSERAGEEIEEIEKLSLQQRVAASVDARASEGVDVSAPAEGALGGATVVAPSAALMPWLSPATPVLALCCLIAAVCALDRVVMSVAILPMAAQYGFGDETKGLVAAAFSLGYCLGLLPSGTLASTASPKVVLGGGLLLWSAAQAATPAAAAAGLPALLGARAVMGLGEAAAVPCLQVIAASFVSAEMRSRFWGVLTASLSLGTISAYKISPPAIEAFGWEFVFEAYGCLGVAVALSWFLFGASAPALEADCLPGPCDLDERWASQDALLQPADAIPTAAATAGAVEFTAATAAPPSADGAAGVGALREAADAIPWRQMASSRPVWALAAAHSASNFFGYFALSWLPTYFNYQFGLSTADASASSLVPFVAGAVGALSAGTLCDYLVSMGGFTLSRARKTMQTVACTGPALALVVLAAGGNALDRQQAEGLFAFAIFCQACSAAGFGCAAQDISTRYASLLYGGTSVLAVVAGASGQYLTGWLLEQNGRDFSPMFALTSVLQVVGLICFLRWWDSERVFE